MTPSGKLNIGWIGELVEFLKRKKKSKFQWQCLNYLKGIEDSETVVSNRKHGTVFIQHEQTKANNPCYSKDGREKNHHFQDTFGCLLFICLAAIWYRGLQQSNNDNNHGKEICQCNSSYRQEESVYGALQESFINKPTCFWIIVLLFPICAVHIATSHY